MIVYVALCCHMWPFMWPYVYPSCPMNNLRPSLIFFNIVIFQGRQAAVGDQWDLIWEDQTWAPIWVAP